MSPSLTEPIHASEARGLGQSATVSTLTCRDLEEIIMKNAPTDNHIEPNLGEPPPPPEVDSVAPKIKREALKAEIGIGVGHTPSVPFEAIGADIDLARPTASEAHEPDGSEKGSTTMRGTVLPPGPATGGDGRLARPVQQPDPSPLGEPVDGLALWDSEAAEVAPAGLETVRLDQNDHLLIPFTRTMLRVTLHYVSFAAIRGYVRCVGPDCLLCRLGRHPEIRDLWPVFDILARAVAVLPISPSMRPHALRSQLFPALRRMANGEGPLLLAVRKDGNSKFLLSALPLPEGADDGRAVIGPFCEQLKAGQVDLASAFPAIPNVELAMIDEVSLIMRAKGLVL
jgi:hypothetical protein